MVRVPATASLLRTFQPHPGGALCCDYSGLRPIYATQSHPKMLTLAHIQSLSGAKLRSGNAPAPKASGWVSAKRELRSSRQAPRESPNARSCLENRERSFHLSQNENHHFTLCLQGCGRFHARKIGEPPNDFSCENRPFTTVSRGLSPTALAFQQDPLDRSGSGSRCRGLAWGCRRGKSDSG